jgi:predicted MFS family arabinose efflux permease
MRARVVILAGGTFVIGTDAFVVAGVLPDIATRLNTSTAEAAQLISIFAIAYAITSPGFGALLSGWDRRLLLVVALAVFVAGNVASALAPTYGLMFASRIVAACGAALFTPTATTLAGTLVPPERRGRAVAAVGSGLTIATVLGVPLLTLVGVGLSFRWTFGVIAMAGAAATLIIFFVFAPVPAGGGATLRQRLGVLRVPGVAPTLLVSICAFTGGFSVYTFISPLFTTSLSVDAEAVTLVLLTFGVAGAIGNTVGGLLTDRVGPTRTVQFGLVLACAGLLALPFVGHSWPGSLAAVATWGLGGWLQVPAQQSRLIAASGAVGAMSVS